MTDFEYRLQRVEETLEKISENLDKASGIHNKLSVQMARFDEKLVIVTKIVYGIVGAVGLAVIGAVLNLVLRS